MEIECKKCGVINNFRTELKGNHVVAHCNVCNSFIKNLPHQAPKFYFGKYKGTLINACEDVNYLQWMLNKNLVKGHIKEAVISQISKLNIYGQ